MARKNSQLLLLPLDGDSRYVPHFDLMADRSAVCTGIVRSSFGTHFLNHLAADRAGLAGGQIAVVALLEVDANLAGGFHLELVHKTALAYGE